MALLGSGPLHPGDLLRIMTHFQPAAFSTRCLTALAAWALCGVALPQSQTVVLEASQDNTLFESTTGVVSNGAGPRGFLGGTGQGFLRRYLIQFDVAGALPSGAVVQSATLGFSTLSLSPNGGPDYFQDIHRMTQAWGEGTSNSGNSGQGAPATTGDATWIHAFNPGTLWSSVGGDFALPASGSYNVTSVGPFSYSSAGLASDVQAWLDQPATNFGWMLKSATELAGTTVALASREANDPSHVPTLTIEYVPPSGMLSTFCSPANANSSGLPAILVGSFGFASESGLSLRVTQGPPVQLGYFLVGAQTNTPGLSVGDGLLCLDISNPSVFGRYNLSGTDRDSLGIFNAAGDLQNLVGTAVGGFGFDVPSTLPFVSDQVLISGQTWHFQAWFRDTAGGSNFSNGLSATF